MKVAIIEDEPLASERLVRMLKNLQSDVQVVRCLDSVSSSVAFFRSEEARQVDLLFMDVELADGVCFDLVNQVELNVPIVFTTAYDQYAVRAFDLNSVHYLLKPVKEADLQSALDKYQRMEKATTADVLAIKELLVTSRGRYKTHFLGKYGNKLVHKSVEAIAYFYSEDKMTYLVDRERKKYLVDYNLEELSEHFLDPQLFFRVSRKYIVNIRAVELLKKHYNQRIQLMLDIRQEHEIIISREKVTDFKNWLNR